MGVGRCRGLSEIAGRGLVPGNVVKFIKIKQKSRFVLNISLFLQFGSILHSATNALIIPVNYSWKVEWKERTKEESDVSLIKKEIQFSLSGFLATCLRALRSGCSN